MRRLFVVLVTIFSFLTSCSAQSGNYKSVEVDDFAQVIADASVVLLDVRSAGEYAEGHLVGAVNIDVRESSFASRALSILPKGQTIAVYCRSGKRSKMAASILSGQGFHVVELNSGYMGWVKEGREVTTEEVDLFVTKEGTNVYVHCIKHGSLRMRIGDKWIYVDPVTTGIQPITDYSNMPKADYILVTHEHFDHLDSVAIRQLTKDGTLLVTNANSSRLLNDEGTVMKNGDKKDLAKAWKLEAVPAYNTSKEKQQFHPKGRDNGYLLTIEGLRVYIAGDTEDIPEMKKLSGVDIAFLPCNLPYTMTPEQLAKAAQMVKPKVLFPYHYGETNVAQMVKALENSGVDVRIRQYR